MPEVHACLATPWNAEAATSITRSMSSALCAAETNAASKGLHLTGNSYAGVGVNDCLSAARSLAHRLASEPVEGPVASV